MKNFTPLELNYLETIIGLEVHAELNTNTKIFCGCSSGYGKEANSQVCPICSGQPGVLPSLNEKVVEYAVMLGTVLGCEINKTCHFDRKNYFYPDLPKAYQISQFYSPICVNGSLEIEVNNEKKNIGIREIHIEEDAGKLIHENNSGLTFIDYNRAGIPLLEIVTNPDFRNEDEVTAFMEKLKEIMLYLEICDCKMEEGSLRVDVNLSLRRSNEEFGTRTETKNLNSIKAISHAIKYERKRQEDIINGGCFIIQQTRSFDDDKNISYPIRSKEDANDYRYFNEPDLQSLCIQNEWIEKIRSNIPELASDKRNRFLNDYGISKEIAEIICTSKNLAKLYEDIARKSGEPIEAANLVIGELIRYLGKSNLDINKFIVDTDKLCFLIIQVKNGKINRTVYKETLNEIFINNIEPEEYLTKNRLFIVNNDDSILGAVRKVMEDNPDAVNKFNSGEEKIFGFLMGQIMKLLDGKGDPKLIKSKLIQLIKETEYA